MNLDKKIEKILQRTDFTLNPFFKHLKDGSMSKVAFYKMQQEFYHAVVGFSAPLSMIAARIPEADMRMKIVKNVWEEHGEGDESKSHGATFQEFMRRLMGPQFEIQINDPGTAVTLFNTTLKGITTNEDYLIGVAVLGMIERMFADISSFIGMVVVERDWMREDQMVHYSVHKDLDCIHSEDFFSILRPQLGSSLEQDRTIETGLELGSLIFLSLFQNLEQLSRHS